MGPFIILDEERLNEFLGDVASGFATTPLEIIIFASSLLFFLTALLVIYLIQNRRLKRKRLTQARRMFEKALSKVELNPMERETLERLAAVFPERDEKRYLVARTPWAFNAAAEKLLEQDKASSAAIAALRIRLGFSRLQGEKPIHSSADLPEGIRVYIRQRNNKKLSPARIVSQKPGCLVVRFQGETGIPATGSEIWVYFSRQNGLFLFSTRVQRRDTDILRLEHSEEISRVQRRRYYRRKLFIPVLMNKVGSDRRLATTLIDLSGGGATVLNPDQLFEAGDKLLLTLELPEEGSLLEGGSAAGMFAAGKLLEGGEAARNVTLVGTVIRLSRNRSRLHIRFEPIRESVRDKIIGFVLYPRA